ncbi:hypothetical protein PTSG_02572 [Salpingoeca rosetta]|uniref:LysM domain-containing protein n=1 Tax=Salpingoeca rosetta (strain ATCC 50818 / BSB-021) TaxID=946362 RepID=F2U2P2_SALR5|nr:uncharacterized protein PTSG_02572 [Salpingoeca rosetta]EGD81886.1 hypothetical protein PTSG_02572 [Salpingoeca rosetta]|eukprot:XP_004996069.1 hypothetical protein PTSG_02572 [Salpingoeca rosetta]
MALLAKNKVRSYGTTTVLNRSDMCIEHDVQDGDSLQSLAIKYDVPVDHILHMNRLFATDSIHLRKTLLIPQSKQSKWKGDDSLDDDDEESLALDGDEHWARHPQQPRHNTAAHDDYVHTHAMNDKTPAPATLHVDDFLKQFDERFALAKTGIETSLKQMSASVQSAGNMPLSSSSSQPSSSSSSSSPSSSSSSSSSSRTRKTARAKAKATKSKQKKAAPATTLSSSTSSSPSKRKGKPARGSLQGGDQALIEKDTHLFEL